MQSVLLLSKSQNLALVVARCLSAAGYVVHVFGEGAFSPVRFSRHCASYTAVDVAFWRSGTVTLESFCERQGIRWIVPADLDCALWLGAARHQLRNVSAFPLAAPELVQAMHDKGSLVDIMRAHGIPHPRSEIVRSRAELLAMDLSQPRFVKPTLGAFGEGAAYIATRKDIDTYLWREQRLKLPLLVQEFVPGFDIDMSILAEHGEIKAWTIQMVGGAPGSRMFLDDDVVYAAGEALVRATRYHGVVHLDMRKDERDGSVKVLEANPRFWNTTAYSMWAGVNFPALGLQMAQGVPLVFARTLGECARPSLEPKAVVAWLTQRTAPRGLSVASTQAWRDSYSDPLPQVVHRMSGAVTKLLG